MSMLFRAYAIWELQNLNERLMDKMCYKDKKTKIVFPSKLLTIKPHNLSGFWLRKKCFAVASVTNT